MKKSTKLFCLLVSILFVATAFVGNAYAEPKSGTTEAQPNVLENISLKWLPTESASSAEGIDLAAFSAARIFIKPFTDLRTNPAEIGKNDEKSGPRVVTTRDTVAGWLTERFSKVLSATGIRVVTTAADATVAIEADITKFYVTEKTRYDAEVTLKVRVKSKNDELIWAGMTSGSENRLGRSYKANNYSEALSNASITAIHALLKNEDFKRAVQKGVK
jgi:hypothetical protein